jgi:hypothetical protein
MFIYSVKFVCGVQNASVAGVPPQCTPVRVGSYATEINIHNFQRAQQAQIDKRVLLLVKDDAPIGREPKSVSSTVFESIKLPADSATMDDCCHLGEKLSFSPTHLNIGFLEISSDVELNVTAVYTATDLKAASISIDVETITGRKV